LVTKSKSEALTFWDSLEAIRRFAGFDRETAVVTPRARPFLSRYEDRATPTRSR
jgi:hypothetical protein